MVRYSDTVFLIRQISKLHLKFDHAWNHINEHSTMGNDTSSRHERKVFSSIYISQKVVIHALNYKAKMFVPLLKSWLKKWITSIEFLKQLPRLEDQTI